MSGVELIIRDSHGREKIVATVDSSALPTGAATAANQALALAQLQLIEDIRDALQSVATDRLIVRGEDQVVSVSGRLAHRTNGAISGADGFIISGTPPVGEYWHITYIAGADTTSPTTVMIFQVQVAGAVQDIKYQAQAFGIGQAFGFPCELWIRNPDTIQVTFTGGLAGDDVRIGLFGHTMTIET